MMKYGVSVKECLKNSPLSYLRCGEENSPGIIWKAVKGKVIPLKMIYLNDVRKDMK